MANEAGGTLFHVNNVSKIYRMGGFVFTKRDRLTPPSKCPVCRHEAIFEPLFTIRQQSHSH